MPDFQNVIKNDQLLLLETVETLMYTPQKAKYPALTPIEVLLSFMKVIHGENEDLFDYLYRFKTEMDILMRLLGNSLIDGYVKQLLDYA